MNIHDHHPIIYAFISQRGGGNKIEVEGKHGREASIVPMGTVKPEMEPAAKINKVNMVTAIFWQRLRRRRLGRPRPGSSSPLDYSWLPRWRSSRFQTPLNWTTHPRPTQSFSFFLFHFFFSILFLFLLLLLLLLLLLFLLLLRFGTNHHQLDTVRRRKCTRGGWVAFATARCP